MYNPEARKQDVEVLENVLSELSNWKPVVVFDKTRNQVHYRGEIHAFVLSEIWNMEELHAFVQSLAGPEYNLVTVE
jgi:hypothetical protein